MKHMDPSSHLVTMATPWLAGTSEDFGYDFGGREKAGGTPVELTVVETSWFPSYLCLYVSHRTAAETLSLQEDNIQDCGVKSAAGSMKMTH